MFKTIEETKMHLPPEIYELIKCLEFDEFTVKQHDLNNDKWVVTKTKERVYVSWCGVEVKKLNWFERIKSILK